MTEQPTTEQPYTQADVEWLGQAMRDDNPPEAWIHPNIVPLDHFAKVALDALAAAGRLLPEGGAEQRMWIFPMDAKVDAILPGGMHRYWSTHCRHGEHGSCSATRIVGDKEDGSGPAAIARKPARCKQCQARCLCLCHQEASNG